MKDYSVLLPCGESTMVVIHDAFDIGYQQGFEDGRTALCDCKDNMEGEYNRGLNDAWEAARKLVHPVNGGYTDDEKEMIFDNLTSDSILLHYTASEAIDKIKEYEQQKQDTIQVGDEVYSEMNDLRFIVTRIITSKHMDITVKRYEGICTDGACYDNLPEDIVKTGRHFDQIAEVLNEMRCRNESD